MRGFGRGGERGGEEGGGAILVPSRHLLFDTTAKQIVLGSKKILRSSLFATLYRRGRWRFLRRVELVNDGFCVRKYAEAATI